MFHRRGYLYFVFLLLTNCLYSIYQLKTNPISSDQQEPEHISIFVIEQGWHAGLAFRISEIPDSLIPEKSDFANSVYIEIGWGDKDYYQNPDPNLMTTLKAGLWPTASAIHMVGFSKPVIEYYFYSEIIEIKLSAQNFSNLCNYVHENFKRDEAGISSLLGEGLYGNSRFYEGKQKFHLFKTCNVWIAKALQTAGCEINPGQSQTTENLMRQVRKIGAVIQQPEK